MIKKNLVVLGVLDMRQLLLKHQAKKNESLTNIRSSITISVSVLVIFISNTIAIVISVMGVGNAVIIVIRII